jgi:hypothetical protein
MRKAQAEVDEVLGDQDIQLGDLGKLKYITGTVLVAAGVATAEVLGSHLARGTSSTTSRNVSNGCTV